MLRAKLNRDELTEAIYDLKEARLTVSFTDGKVFHYDHAKESDFNGIIAAAKPRCEWEDSFLPRYEKERG